MKCTSWWGRRTGAHCERISPMRLINTPTTPRPVSRRHHTVQAVNYSHHILHIPPSTSLSLNTKQLKTTRLCPKSCNYHITYFMNKNVYQLLNLISKSRRFLHLHSSPLRAGLKVMLFSRSWFATYSKWDTPTSLPVSFGAPGPPPAAIPTAVRDHLRGLPISQENAPLLPW